MTCPAPCPALLVHLTWCFLPPTRGALAADARPPRAACARRPPRTRRWRASPARWTTAASRAWTWSSRRGSRCGGAQVQAPAALGAFWGRGARGRPACADVTAAAAAGACTASATPHAIDPFNPHPNQTPNTNKNTQTGRGSEAAHLCRPGGPLPPRRDPVDQHLHHRHLTGGCLLFPTFPGFDSVLGWVGMVWAEMV